MKHKKLRLSLFFFTAITLTAFFSCTKPASPSNTATAPLLTTATVASITQISAQSGGTITSDGGASITVRGICWNIVANPTIANNKTTDGSGTGAFTSTLSGLIGNTTYYVRAYAINTVGIAYGNEISFTTQPTVITIPTIATENVTEITDNSAQSGGTITSDGGAAITAKGVCWTTSVNPTIANNKTTDGTGSGNFMSNVQSLMSNTTYYVRAYATNSAGTAYGNSITFSTPQSILDSLKNGLVAFYPFSGNVDDSSGNNNLGTNNGATLTTDRFGAANKAYSFNGTSSFIKIPNSSSLTASTYQLTIAAWVKLNQFTGSPNKAASIVDKANGSSGDWGIFYQDFDANPAVEKLRFGGYIWYSSVILSQGLRTSTVPTQNQWVHIAYTIDGNSVTNYYINGVNESQIGNGGNGFSLWENNADMYIGRSGTVNGNYYGFTGSNYNYFNGAIDEVRIYNRVLSPTEVQYLATH